MQAETKRIYSIMYSERLENRATVKAGELVAAGAIGRVVQTIGLGPHRMSPKTRPAWFFDRAALRRHPVRHRLAPGRPVPLLHAARPAPTSSRRRSATCIIPQYPKFEDFGDVTLRGDRGTGYIRVDWFTPDGLATWGDGRLTILGTDGFIEIRKNIDIGGRPGGSHLFLVDQKETRYVDCATVRAAVRRAARRRRRQPHRDRDAAGALLPGDRADAQGADSRRSD